MATPSTPARPSLARSPSSLMGSRRFSLGSSKKNLKPEPAEDEETERRKSISAVKAAADEEQERLVADGARIIHGFPRSKHVKLPILCASDFFHSHPFESLCFLK